MGGEKWLPAPVGLESGRWITRRPGRTVLVAVHTVVAGTRLLDLAPLFGADPRIQVVFTAAPAAIDSGVEEFLRQMGGVVLPWRQATQTKFDLAVAADYQGLNELHAPVVVMSHGAGYAKLTSRQMSGGALAERSVFGLDRERLVADGRVIATRLALAHREELGRLARYCPEALSAAAVVGDPCYDGLMAGRRWRERYRRALRVDAGQRLVVVSSTWGPHSLLGRCPEVLMGLLGQLPARGYRVALLLHPHAWFVHGRWQILSWLEDGLKAGLALIPPERGWQATLASADWIVGDHGSVTLYGASVGVPLVLATFPRDEVPPDSPTAELAEAVPYLDVNQPFEAALQHARETCDPGRLRRIAARITSQPGHFAANIRRVVYDVLALPEPAVPAPSRPPALPVPVFHSSRRGL